MTEYKLFAINENCEITEITTVSEITEPGEKKMKRYIDDYLPYIIKGNCLTFAHLKDGELQRLIKTVYPCNGMSERLTTDTIKGLLTNIKY